MGCIRSRTPGSYQLLFYVDGVQKSKTIKGTKRDAERMLREIERQVDQGEYQEGVKKVVTVGDVLEKWLAGVKARRAITTYETYERSVRLWLLPAFGATPLADLGPGRIEAVYAGWLTAGMSPQSIANHHTPLAGALRSALKDELVHRNAADLVDLPARCSTEKTALSDEQMQLVTRGMNSKYGPHAALSAMTGLRLGEVCGLMWGDIDADKRELVVERSAARVRGGDVILKPPKTKSSRRRVSLPAEAVTLLSSLPRRGVFVFGDDQPPNPSNVCNGVRKMLRGLGVSMHGLRHAHASLLNRMGENPKVVQERLGHSSLGETMDTYTHLLPSQQVELAARLDERMRQQQ